MPSDNIILKRTTSSNPDFKNLTILLDKELHNQYGDLQSEYDRYNHIIDINTVVIAYRDKSAVGCGCFKQIDDTSAELKRMFVKPDERKHGIGSSILSELEIWAKERGFLYAVLETANKQHESIALYKKAGFSIIPNYGEYIGKEISVCMKKKL